MPYDQFQPNAPAYAGGPALRRTPAIPMGQALTGGGRPGPRVPGVAMLPTGSALGPAAASMVAEAIAEIAATPNASRAKIKKSLQNRGVEPSDEELDRVVDLVKSEQEGGPVTAPPEGGGFDPRREMAENLFNLQNLQGTVPPAEQPPLGPPSSVRPPELLPPTPADQGALAPMAAAPGFDPRAEMSGIMKNLPGAAPVPVVDEWRGAQPNIPQPAGALAPFAIPAPAATGIDPREEMAANLANLARLQGRTTRPGSTAVAGADVLAEGDIGGVPAERAPLATDFEGMPVPAGALPPIAPTVPTAPAQADVRLGAPAAPATLMGEPASAGIKAPVYPSVEPTGVASIADPTKPAPAKSVTAATGGVIQALLKENRVSAEAAKKLDKQDMGMGLLMAGLTTLGRPSRIGDNAFTGVATGVQSGINYALSQKATRAKRADKNFDKRLKVAGLYKDLTVAEAKLQAAAADKAATRAERARNNKALEGLRGDMIAVRQEANRLTSEKNRTVINRGGADAMEEVEKMMAEDLAGVLNRGQLVQSLVLDAHPGSAAAGKIQRSNYSRAIAAINADPRSTPAQKAKRKAEAKRRIGGWLKDWGHKGI